jgi:transposase-like protein
MDKTHPHHPQWRPPFCPNDKCIHHNGLNDTWSYKSIGTYTRKAAPKRIRRFLCKVCARSFSCQTFSPDYWLKRPDIFAKLMTKTCGGMANRQIARDLGVAPNTIDLQLQRLGRHCLLFHQQQVDNMSPPRDITIDGFESFELSQYFPFHFNLAVDNETGMFLGFTDSPLRRKGRMTDHQKRRRTELEAQFGRPDPQAVRKDVRHLLEMLTAGAQEMFIRSDDHRSYPRAMRGLACRITHQVTSSKERRDKRNPLWEVNLLDLLIRHSSGGHKRETIAWPKRRNASALRLAIFMVWRNWVNQRWQKRCRGTPAMQAGLCNLGLTVAEVLKVRIFASQVELSERWRSYFRADVVTPALGLNRRHELKYAA